MNIPFCMAPKTDFVVKVTNTVLFCIKFKIHVKQDEVHGVRKKIRYSDFLSLVCSASVKHTVLRFLRR